MATVSKEVMTGVVKRRALRMVVSVRAKRKAARMATRTPEDSIMNSSEGSPEENSS
jgi:hypothetical protein